MLTSGQFIAIYTISQYLEINYIDIFSRNVLPNPSFLGSELFVISRGIPGKRVKISSKFRRTVQLFFHKSRNTCTLISDLRQTTAVARPPISLNQKDRRGNLTVRSFSGHSLGSYRDYYKDGKDFFHTF